jgi:SulP family sulfate permease
MGAFKVIGVQPRVMILDLSAVPAMDVTGLVALESALARLKEQGVLAIVTALRPQPSQVLRKAGVHEEPSSLLFSDTLVSAAATASRYLENTPRKRV